MLAEWNLGLVLLSVLVAMLGSFTALSHARRMRASAGRPQLYWMTAGGVTLGLAIWAMHFIGMLAMHLPIELRYDAGLTLLSIVPAIGAALLGFHLLKMPRLKARPILFGGAAMGAGISAMHYIGMAALRMSPAIAYDPWIVALSVLIAVGAAIGAMLIVYAGELSGLLSRWAQLAGAVIMGIAIAGMHYTAMHGMHIEAGSVCLVQGTQVDPGLLVLMITVGVLLLFGGGLIATLFDERLTDQSARALARLQALLDYNPDGLIIVDREGCITFVNRQAERLYDYRRE